MPISCFSDYKEELLPVVGSIRKPVESPKVVGIDNIKSLLRTGCEIKGDYKVLRFLVKEDKTIVFAPEGPPAEGTPAHWQMTGINNMLGAPKCLTAGNVFFNKKNNKLVAINHKSGDFRPDFNSLPIALRVLSNSSLPIADEVTIVQLDARGADIQKFTYTKKELMDAYREPSNVVLSNNQKASIPLIAVGMLSGIIGSLILTHVIEIAILTAVKGAVLAGLTATALTGIGLIALSIGLIGVGIFLLFKKGESNQKNAQSESSNSKHSSHQTIEYRNNLSALRDSQGRESTAVSDLTDTTVSGASAVSV